MPHRDLRAYIEELSRRDLLHVIDESVSKDTELVPLVRLQFRGLPEDQRKRLFDDFRSHRGDFRDWRSRYRDQQARLIAAIAAEPFDRAAVAAILDAQRSAWSDLHATSQALILDRLAEMPAADRAALAETMRRPPRRGDRYGHDRD